MSVKRSKSGTRVLAVLEEIARTQPVGVSELARLLEADKSAVQRAIMTLADEGWIGPAPGGTTRWQLTGHIQLVAHQALGSSGLRQRARPALEALRNATGETVGLTVPDIGRFVVIEVLESRQVLRTVPHVGMVVTTDESATGPAVLAYLPRADQVRLLGREPDAALERDFETVRRQGYFVSEGDVQGASIPRARLTREHYERVGGLVLQTARELSLARPPQAGTPAARVRA
jgi:DNA-binding IclR family transcriptional regulator